MTPPLSHEETVGLRDEIRRAGAYTQAARLQGVSVGVGLAYLLVVLLAFRGWLLPDLHGIEAGVAAWLSVGLFSIPLGLPLALWMGNRYRRRRLRELLPVLQNLPRQKSTELLVSLSGEGGAARGMAVPLLRELGNAHELSPAAAARGRGDEAGPAG